MVGQTQRQYRYYRCRRSYAGPRHDRCSSRYAPAAELEAAVRDKVLEVLAHPDVVISELEHAANRSVDRARAQEVTSKIESLEAESDRVLRLFQLGRVDERYMNRELDSIAKRRVRLGSLIEEHQPDFVPPDDPEAIEALCQRVREWVEKEVAEGRLGEILNALQIEAHVGRDGKRTIDTVSGVLPDDLPESFQSHCTNIGITVQ